MATGSPLRALQTYRLTLTAFYYYSRHPTQYTSRTPSLTRSFLDCDVFVATTLISLRKQRKCASSSRHAVIPIQLFTIANTAHSQSIHNRHHYLQTTNKKKEIPIALTFHPHNISVKNIILKNFKLLQHDPATAEIFFATTPHFIQTEQKLK